MEIAQKIMFTFLEYKPVLTADSYLDSPEREQSKLALTKGLNELCGEHQKVLNFSAGLLLKAVEYPAMYPYIIMSAVEPTNNGNDEEQFHMYATKLRKLTVGEPIIHKTGLYQPVTYLLRKRDSIQASVATTSNDTGFILIGYKLLHQETTSATLEHNWLAWSGATEIYRCSPKSWDLRQITLFRCCDMRSRTDFAYILISEFGTIMTSENVHRAFDIIQGLRDRRCGYVAFYRVYGHLENSPSSSRSESTQSTNYTPLSRSHSTASSMLFDQPVQGEGTASPKIPNIPPPTSSGRKQQNRVYKGSSARCGSVDTFLS